MSGDASPLRFRDATLADLAFVVDGLRENRRIEGAASPTRVADVEEYGARITAGTVRVAEDGEGAALGFLSYALDFEVLYVEGPTLWIDLVYVRADQRGRGLGRALYEEAARLARAHGRTRVVADVFAANEASGAFHRGVGFTPLYTIFTREV